MGALDRASVEITLLREVVMIHFVLFMGLAVISGICAHMNLKRENPRYFLGGLLIGTAVLLASAALTPMF